MAKRKGVPSPENVEKSSGEQAASFLVVGVGASAGGLEAFTQFLHAIPGDTGASFVLVQHLAANRPSALTEILSRATSMPVMEVVDEPLVEPNHVYVIPPDCSMVITDRHLRLFEREPGVQHHPVDVFFRSLADSLEELAVGVVLSGTATDGTFGLEEIKAAGGITFAQDETAQYDGMPRSAISKGCVDFILPPDGIAGEIARIAGLRLVRRKSLPEAPAEDGESKEALAPIVELLRRFTNVDFSHYKVNTLSRRIRRRMVLHKQEGLAEYLQLLRKDQAEVQALYEDILIHVTSFFRDAAVFETLKTSTFPALLKDRSRSDPVRIWTLGCSTGEEAYSLAMAYTEAAEAVGGASHIPAQIFATDVKSTGIDHARAGLYSSQHLSGVSSERLRRFFVEASAGSYRITKSIRDMCVFACHNVLSDPPFSQIDLISCRNLLIYIEPSLQQRIMPLIHYALKPDGRLLLGASETVGQSRDLFQILDAKHKIFSKKPLSGRFPPNLSMPGARKPPSGQDRRPISAYNLPTSAGFSSVYKEADRLLAARFAPPGVLIDSDLNILHFRGNTEPYLTAAQGKASLELLKMAREGLVVPLRALVYRSKKEKTWVRDEGIVLDSGDGQRLVNLEVVPLKSDEELEGGFLILFEDVTGVDGKTPLKSTKPAENLEPRPKRDAVEETILRLEHELSGTRHYLQSLVEQHDATNEELESANEEAQSANEELQSINEELETAKEETQSSNEELTTVNEELQNRNSELGQLIGDLNNLILSVDIAFVIISRDLRIRRFSPKAEKLMNLHFPSEGRSILDVKFEPIVDDLESLLLEVIETVAPQEREVQDKSGRWYSLRVQPYKTVDNKIDGAVMMLVDIDSFKKVESAILDSRDFAQNTLDAMSEPLLVVDDQMRIESANPAFFNAFQTKPKTIIGKLLFDIRSREWDISALRTQLKNLLPHKSTIEGFDVKKNFKGLGERVMRVSARRIEDPVRNTLRILIAICDVTGATRSEERIHHSETRYRRLFEAARDGILILDPETRKIVDVNPFMTKFLGYARDEFLGKELFEFGLPKDEKASRAAFLKLRKRGYIRYDDLPLQSKTGERREVEFVSNLYQEGGEQIIQSNVRDISERRLAEEALSKSAAEFRELADSMPQIVWAARPDGFIDYYNRRWYDFTGLPEVFGHESWTPLLHPDDLDRVLKVYKGSIRGGRPLSVEFRFKDRSSGGYRWFVCRGLPVKNELGEIIRWYGTTTDIQEQKEQEQKLENMVRERTSTLDAALREMEGFSYTVAHDLRPPLRAIIFTSKMLAEGAGAELTEDHRQMLVTQVTSAQKLAFLIDDLLQLAQIARVPIERKAVDLSALAHKATEELCRSQTGTPRELEIQKGLTCDADAGLLKIVLTNLIENAVKFSPAGGKIAVGRSRTDRRHPFFVRDEGIGFDMAHADRVFLPFERLHHEHEYPGTGIGLATVKRIIERHEGTVWVDSAAGRGTTVYFTLSAST